MARGFYLEVCSQDGSIIPYKIVITDYEDLSKEEQATNAEKTGSIDVSAIEKQYGIPQSPDEEHLREKEQEERREKAAARTKKIIEDGYTVFACQRMDFNPRNGTKGTFKSSMQNANHYDLKRFDHYLPIWDPDNTQDMVFLYRISDGEFFPSASKATCCRSSNLVRFFGFFFLIYLDQQSYFWSR